MSGLLVSGLGFFLVWMTSGFRLCMMWLSVGFLSSYFESGTLVNATMQALLCMPFVKVILS